MSDPTLESEIGPAHLALLRQLSETPQVSQRELSQHLGFSLGKTHYLLRALAGKGLVKMQNFARSTDKASYGYLLTPYGIREKLELTREFLQHKELEFQALQREIVALRAELDQQQSPPDGETS